MCVDFARALWASFFFRFMLCKKSSTSENMPNGFWLFDDTSLVAACYNQLRSLPTSVSGRITSFPPFISVRDPPHFAARHTVAKDNAENSDLLKNKIKKILVIIVLNQFFPLALSRLTLGHLLKKVNKSARNLRVPAKGQDLTRPRWKMLTAMEGPKLEDAECSAVIRQARTEFFSRCKRLNMNYVSAGLFPFLKTRCQYV